MKVIDVEEEIKSRNLVFNNATNAEKRVLIAKDVIKQLKIGRLSAAGNTFFRISCVSPDAYPDVNAFMLTVDESTRDKSVQHELLKNNITCACCADGALFLSTVLFLNKATMSTFSWASTADFGQVIKGNRKSSNGFEKIFSIKQLRLIEIAFENGNGFFNFIGCNKPFVKRINQFYNQYKNSNTRLIAIMKNIIANKGTFILP